MPKYFFSSDQLQGDKIVLQGDTAHHLLHVLRVGIGDKATLCDSANTDYRGTVEAISTKSKTPTVTFNIEESTPCNTEPHTKVTLYQSLPKGDKLDIIIQKCVELGVFAIIPVMTTRSVARLKDAQRKISRYGRIAESAAGQSMRGIIPTVHTAISFARAVEEMDTSALTLVAYEEEKMQSLKNAVSSSPSTINLWIGPEGGFTTEEIATLQKNQAISMTLGKRILRTETAAIAALAQILCLLES